jgi:hypothetical protein
MSGSNANRLGREAVRLQRLDVSLRQACHFLELTSLVGESRQASSFVEAFAIQPSEVLVLERATAISEWMFVWHIRPRLNSDDVTCDAARPTARSSSPTAPEPRLANERTLRQ